jgi:hypothetical protein
MTQYTTEEVTWNLLQFVPPVERLFPEGRVNAAVEARLNELRALRKWVGQNLRSARDILPGIGSDFVAVVVGGRRQCMSPQDVTHIKELNEETPGINVRTYDWIVDGAMRAASSEDLAR